MGDFKSIMPGVSFSVVFGKTIDPLSFGYFKEGTVLVPGIEEFSFGVPEVFVEFGSV